ncbi:hypothetical protein FHS29_002100 [Saccharothrix tamanrassetensis]|uniref:DUF397 domain-containing protein n=1 Tax=Saccharothrix tamanrassetensis TaxID=1051531 RepID=A0A841CDT5_9PSEU|nr:DUF397 domain-containing protein [Saccharothrix tamanrassetensis]MBB5955519.1 hypothetical protein [Saccharothrix tamanrassetensis]
MRHDTGWLKSSHSAAANNDCVEVRPTDASVDVRDSKNPTGPRLTISGKGWTAFVAELKR